MADGERRTTTMGAADEDTDTELTGERGRTESSRRASAGGPHDAGR